jgi:acetyl-CoA C-acetyltransferase
MIESGLSEEDIDLWEVNEAFAMVPISFAKEMGIEGDKINVIGGSLSIGHPLGCRGIGQVNTLISALRMKWKKRGFATICNGGGGGTAVIIELI